MDRKLLKKISARLDDKLLEHKSTCVALRREREALRSAEERLAAYNSAVKIAQEVAQDVQTRAHAQISTIVTRCLRAVFDDPYEFKILFEQKRGKTEAHLIFERDGEAVDPLSATGGGVVDVAAFALRVSCLLLSRPPLRKVIVLDEPFKFVSEEYRGRLCELIMQLAEELQIQFIIVTHIKELMIGKVVYVQKGAARGSRQERKKGV